jgi:hypothetical protein
VSHDPRRAELDPVQEPPLRLPWLIAPAVAVLVVLLMVGVTSLLWRP